MLVDLEATRLINNRAVTDLADFIAQRRSQLRVTPHSRDTKFIIQTCVSALKKFNPDVRSIDFETVYMEKDNFIIIGVIHEGNLIKAYDSKAICEQFHLDNTMAIFAHPIHIFRVTDQNKNLMIDIPNKLQYDETYYAQHIFKDFIGDNCNADSFDSSNKEKISTLINLVHRSAYIIKDTTRMDRNAVDVLTDLIHHYGAYVRDIRMDEFDVPDKYVISKTWFDKIHVNIAKNPFFIFRHVWRCYFRLCKEGYRFNA